MWCLCHDHLYQWDGIMFRMMPCLLFRPAVLYTLESHSDSHNLFSEIFTHESKLCFTTKFHQQQQSWKNQNLRGESYSCSWLLYINYIQRPIESGRCWYHFILLESCTRVRLHILRIPKPYFSPLLFCWYFKLLASQRCNLQLRLFWKFNSGGNSTEEPLEVKARNASQWSMDVWAAQ